MWISSVNYIELGYAPTIGENNEPIFTLQAVIVAGETHMTLSDEELANLFMFIRSKPEYSDAPGQDVYYDFVRNDFRGIFSLNYHHDDYSLNFVSENDEIQRILLAWDAIAHLLMFEKLINKALNNLTVMQNELMEKLEALVITCDGNAENIINIAEASGDHFHVEMATNGYEFFSKLCTN